MSTDNPKDPLVCRFMRRFITEQRKQEKRIRNSYRKLEELVPPLDLCQKIPQGEFADSAFYWFAELQHINKTPPHEYRFFIERSNFDRYGWGGGKFYPAPTLQEIMEELDPLQDAFYAEFDDGSRAWMVADSGYESNAATAAIKAWLEKKGIAL